MHTGVTIGLGQCFSKAVLGSIAAINYLVRKGILRSKMFRKLASLCHRVHLDITETNTAKNQQRNLFNPPNPNFSKTPSSSLLPCNDDQQPVGVFSVDNTLVKTGPRKPGVLGVHAELSSL